MTYVQRQSGPLPPSQELKGYEEVLTGAAERILQMAEEESRHRRTIEKDIVRAEISAETRGQWLGAGLAVIGVSGGVVAAVLGSPGLGASLSIVSLAGAFGSPWLRILTTRSQNDAGNDQKP